MTDAIVTLDKSRAFSECRGDRTPEDPMYRVAYWQGQLVGKDMVLLPFDTEGNIVPDDGKAGPWQGMNADGKPCTYFPLYNDKMRDLLAKKKRRADKLAAKAEEEQVVDDTDDDPATLTEEVNFPAFLRGDVTYDWPLLQKAARKRFHRVFQKKDELVYDLVLEERIIPEDQLAPQYARYLNQRPVELPNPLER